MEKNLNFNEYMSSVYKKAGKKLSVYARLSNFMSIKQRRVLMKSFIELQFRYLSFNMNVPWQKGK